MGRVIEKAVQLVARDWSAVTRLVGLKSSDTAYRRYFIYDERSALLLVIRSRSYSVLSVRRHTSLDRVENPVKTEAEEDTAAWEHSAPVSDEIRLWPLQFSASFTLCLAIPASTRSTTTIFLSRTGWNSFLLPLWFFLRFRFALQ